nr:hemolysin family protein [Pontibacillus halophilus]
MMVWLKLLSVVLLIVLTAFFVASEFAIVKVRKSRIEALAEQGDKKAKLALHIINRLDAYLSACQLGITITSLGLGWLGEPAVDTLLSPLFEQLPFPSGVTHTISFAVAFAIITFLHVVLGELAPKTVAIQKAEAITLALARPLDFFYKMMLPFIFVLNGSANLFVRLFGFRTANEGEEAHTEEELRYILTQSYEKGEINQSEYTYVDRIFEFDNRTAKEIMIPRTEMVVLNLHEPMKDILKRIRKERFSRYPVIDQDKDKVVGIVHMKELFADECDEHHTLSDYIRPAHKVFENIAIQDLLVKLQTDQTHLAILVDEYGGTAGLVTVEDILEEIVGEIRDEFDHEEVLPFEIREDGSYVMDGKIAIQDVNDYLTTQLSHEEVDTISGWLLTKDIDARKGTSVTEQGFTFTIIEMEDTHIRKVEVKRDET